jgi:hypothetical protein
MSGAENDEEKQNGNPDWTANHKRFLDRDYTSFRSRAKAKIREEEKKAAQFRCRALIASEEPYVPACPQGGQLELYIDDMLMQSFFMFTPSGRIGFIAQESEAHFRS